MRRECPRGFLLYFVLVALLLSCMAGAGAGEACVSGEAVLRRVDPFIGTGGGGFAQGNAFVGAAAPFGMVRLGPDTWGKLGRAGFAHAAGYWYRDKVIEGFSHTHMHGTGVEDYGNVLLVPVLGMDAGKTDERGYGSPFSHETETASPGYYAVTLKKPGVRAELTATERAGLHRYTYKQEGEPVVIVDPTHLLGEGGTLAAEILVKPGTGEVEGWALSAGRFVGRSGAFKVYFAARFSEPFDAYGIWEPGKLHEGKTSFASRAYGQRFGAYVQFVPAAQKVVEARVGISFVSLENARRHQREELGAKTLEQVRKQTEGAWRKLLAKVSVCGGTEEERRIFYTALYHTMLMPTLFTDLDGRYLGLDKKIHTAEGFRYYTDFSLWDTYRTLHPLYTWLLPDRQLDMLRSLLAMGEAIGYLPRWPLAGHETGVMAGSPADMVIAESYLKGIRGFDANRAFQLMKQAALQGIGTRNRHCNEHGFCPADKTGGSVSETLEYAYSDFAIALLARALGEEADFRLFSERSKAYRHLWDASSAFFRPKQSDGTFLADDQFHPDGALQPHFVEGNAWQYLFFVPWDLPGLIQLFGSREAMLSKLDLFFEQSVAQPAKEISRGILGPDLYYWHGNEPDIHAPYIYALSGAPDRGAKWIRWVLRAKYDDTPDGLAGNDDGGTLSAWYVFSALGLYPVAGTDFYAIGSPIFEKVTLHLPAGSFVIQAPGTSRENLYVESATLSGKPLSYPWVRHRHISRPGKLTLKMGMEPRGWGAGGALNFLEE